MAQESVYWDILNTVAWNIQGLGLSFLNQPQVGKPTAAQQRSAVVPVNIRKLPTKEETLDTTPLICVCPHETPPRPEILSFEAGCGIQRRYYVEVVIIASGGRDFYTNLDVWLNWRQQINGLFQQTPLAGSVWPGAAQVFQMMADEGYVIARDQINDNYEYSGLGYWFIAAEQRTNPS